MGEREVGWGRGSGGNGAGFSENHGQMSRKIYYGRNIGKSAYNTNLYADVSRTSAVWKTKQ